MDKIDYVLIVDDDEIARFVAERTLKLLGIANEIKTANNGKEAANHFEEMKGNFPDLILLDINMPLMDGFEFLDWYDQNGFKGTTKIIMYTSSERAIDSERAVLYEDVMGYISKPITQEKIEAVLLGTAQTLIR